MATTYGNALVTATKSNPGGTSGIETNTSTALDQLGTIMVAYDSTYGQKWFMYVKASGAITKGASVIMTGSPYVVKQDTTTAKRNHTKIAGVAAHAFTTLYYGWIQVKGFANVLIQGTPAIGTAVSAPATAAGAAAVTSGTTSAPNMNVGTTLATGTDGRYGPVDLLIS